LKSCAEPSAMLFFKRQLLREIACKTVRAVYRTEVFRSASLSFGHQIGMNRVNSTVKEPRASNIGDRGSLSVPRLPNRPLLFPFG
jgi:hypothetical protein